MLRREVVKMAGSLLGAGTPSRFPYPDRPQPSPGVGPGQSAVTRARVVIVSGPTGAVNGVFVYSPGTTPALGNPPIAWITASGSDPFGNTLPSATGIIIGTGNPTSGPVVGLGQGQLTGYASGELAGSIQFPGSRAMRLVTPTQNLADTAGILSMFAESFTGVLPRMAFNGQVIFTSGTAAAPTLITTDTWHQVGVAGFSAFVNGWANPGAEHLDVTLNADNTVTIAGRVSNAAGTAGNSLVCTLPAPYQTANRVEFAPADQTNAAVSHTVQLDTAGNFQVNGAVAAGGIVAVQARFPLGAPA